MSGEASSASTAGVWTLPEIVGVSDEVERLRETLAEFVARSDPEVKDILDYQLSGNSKYFRPVTAFACHRAACGRPAGDDVVRAVAAAELFHNYTLVIDDIVDRDRYRRGRLALHCRYGWLRGLMSGAYLAFGAIGSVAHDPYLTRVFDDLGRRIVVAECRQWQLRRRALSVDDWRTIAGEDTGALFETCARVAVRDGSMDRFAYLVGTLYHGCDDVADIRGTAALGTESEKDVTDRILTLVAAIAVQDPAVAELYEEAGPDGDAELAERLADALPAAEAVLDEIEREAREEARLRARDPDALLELVRWTRALADA